MIFWNSCKGYHNVIIHDVNEYIYTYRLYEYLHISYNQFIIKQNINYLININPGEKSK